jgi:hypothetical protein
MAEADDPNWGLVHLNFHFAGDRDRTKVQFRVSRKDATLITSLSAEQLYWFCMNEELIVLARNDVEVPVNVCIIITAKNG